MIHGVYIAAIAIAFTYGVSTYLRRRQPKEIEDDGSNFAYIKNLHKEKKIDDAAFEALVIISNEPDVEFIRVPPAPIAAPTRRRKSMSPLRGSHLKLAAFLIAYLVFLIILNSL